jgi:hypothetical protein
VTTSQPQWIGVTVWNGEMWMLRRANHMHSDGASLGGAQTRPRRAVARLWQGCVGIARRGCGRAAAYKKPNEESSPFTQYGGRKRAEAWCVKS